MDNDSQNSNYVDFQEESLSDNFQLQPQIFTETVSSAEQTPTSAFDDPGSYWFPKRFWLGFKYPFKALLLCFTKSYSILALLDTIVLNLIILASIALGIFLGIVIVDAIIPHQV